MYSEQMLTEYINKSGYVQGIAEGLKEYDRAYGRRYGRSEYDEFDFDMSGRNRNADGAHIDMSKLYVTSRALVQVYLANDTWDGFMADAMPLILQKMELNGKVVESRIVCRLIAKAIYAFFSRVGI